MSISSSVFTIPGSSTEKLPFVHSNFKPRFTFAKSFGGRRRYSKVCACTREEKVGRLPQIKYNGTDQRKLITFGSVRRGERREYPGFLGHAKISQRKIDSMNGNNNGKDENNGKKVSKSYGSLPDLASKRNRSKFFNHHQQIFSEKVMDTGGNDSDMQELVYNSLESLIFVDDDDHVDDGKSHSSSRQCTEKNDDNGETTKKSSTGQKTGSNIRLKDSPKNGGTNSRRVHYEDPTDSLKEELDKKISEARGKSGMKRARRKESDHNIRALGDVITPKRLAELLSSRSKDSALAFS